MLGGHLLCSQAAVPSGLILCQPGWVLKNTSVAGTLWLQDVRTSAS